MTDAIKKLREPAALGAAAFAALITLAAIISLLFTSGGSFSDIAYSDTGNLLSLPVAAAVAFAVYLANHVGPALPKARLVTLIALVTVAAAAVFGLVSFFAGFGAQDASGTGKFAYFLAGAGGAIVIGLAGWYTWLTWQTHAPARPAAPAAAGAAPGGWVPPQQQHGGPQQHGAPQGGAPQQAPGQPGAQQPAGFGWKPGNAAEQTAYLPPQPGGDLGPQTLQAQQSATGSYAVPPHLQQQPGGQPGQPGPQAHGGGERTQMIPPVPPTMQEYAPDPQPWQPQGGAPQGGVPQPPPTRPMNPNDGQTAEGAGPFGVGNWQ
ncbi:hypothetical protein [Actinospica sp.]|uniref:hypothetical protein n=1 Tax=Actinospica sp. TaxID=1872142 RepID=UPI002C4436B2|nr:hypothetical protein [Actinospica sp.]HWG23878.1 hypothetical protein [Actinospica sp.]